MIWQLMQRDPAWRWMPYFVMASGALGLLGHFIMTGTVGVQAGFDVAYFQLPFLAGFTATIQQGDSRFQSALPVTVREVYLSRVVSMMAAIWLPAVVTIGMARAMPNAAFPVGALLERVSVSTAAMVGLQAVGIRGLKILSPALVFILSFAWIVLPDIWHTPVVPLVCGFAALGTFLWTWRTVPKTFQSAPLEVSRAEKAAGAASSDRQSAYPWRPVLRTVFPWGGFWIIVPFVMMLLGAFRPYIFIFAGGAWQSARPAVRWLFTLPVSRRVILNGILFSVLFSFGGGYLVSIQLPSIPTPAFRGIWVRPYQELPQWSGSHEAAECKTPNVLPSLDFWVVAKGGQVPRIEAPWGETFQPPVFRKAGFDILNPYAVGCENSERFLDWQFSRATEAVYGRPLPRDKDESWQTGHVVVTSLRTQFVNVAFIAASAMLAMMVALLNDWRGFRRISGPARITLMSLPVGAGITVMLLDSANKLPVTQWMSWVLPQSLPAAILLAIVPLAVVYWLLDVLFREVELVDRAEGRAA